MSESPCSLPHWAEELMHDQNLQNFFSWTSAHSTIDQFIPTLTRTDSIQANEKNLHEKSKAPSKEIVLPLFRSLSLNRSATSLSMSRRTAYKVGPVACCG